MSGRPSGAVNIHTESGGSGGPVLAMLHGMGANAAVWRRMLPIVERRWPGRWVAVDLRGHGRSAHAPPYGYAVHAADVAHALGGRDEELVLLGHSMGGVVAMALATGWFGVAVRQVFAFGVKIGWTEAEVAQMKGLAAKPARVFDSRAEAAARYLRVSGLAGLVEPGAPEALAGIAETEGGYRLAADQRIYATVGPRSPTSAGPPPRRSGSPPATPIRWSPSPRCRRSIPTPRSCPASATTAMSRRRSGSGRCSRHPSRARASPSSKDPLPHRSAQIGTVLPEKIEIDRTVCILWPIPSLLPLSPRIPVLPPRTLRYAPALSRGYSG